MGVLFDNSEILQRDGREYLEGAKAARQFILEDRHTLLRGLIGDFRRLFGNSPASDEAKEFLEIMRDELDAARQDLSEIYGRPID